MRLRSAVLCVLCVLRGCFLLFAQHPLTEADLGLLKGVADARISPDGTAIAYTRTTTNYANNQAQSEVVMVNAASGQVLRVYPGYDPRWAPNSRSLAFRGDLQGQPGIWVYDLSAAG